MLTKLKCAQSQFSTSFLPLLTTSLEECLKHLKKLFSFPSGLINSMIAKYFSSGHIWSRVCMNWELSQGGKYPVICFPSQSLYFLFPLPCISTPAVYCTWNIKRKLNNRIERPNWASAESKQLEHFIFDVKLENPHIDNVSSIHFSISLVILEGITDRSGRCQCLW